MFPYGVTCLTSRSSRARCRQRVLALGHVGRARVTGIVYVCFFLVFLVPTNHADCHLASAPSSPVKSSRSSPLKSVSSPLLKVSAQSTYLASKSFDDPSMSSIYIYIYLLAFLTIDHSVQYLYMMAGNAKEGPVFSLRMWTSPTFPRGRCTALPHVKSPLARSSPLGILSLHILVTRAPFSLLIFSLSYSWLPFRF